MPEDYLQVLYDHYKDTYSLIERNIAQRDRNFIWAISLVVVAFTLTVNPGTVIEAIQGIGKEQLKIDVKPTYYALNSSILFISVWFWIKYFQVNLHQETLYEYIHKIENKLSELAPQIELQREGNAYLQSYPMLKTLIHTFYTVVVPILLIAVAAAKGYYEWLVEMSHIPISIRMIDSIGILMLMTSSILYLSWIHFRDSKKNIYGACKRMLQFWRRR